ncbi:uncharacterized protein PHACADRAFT_257445, partial [Phanerochaete carnosa HHB-10118-sp]
VERISSSIATLTLTFQSFDHFGLIKALPRLLQLVVRGLGSNRVDILAQAYTCMPRLKSTGRSLAQLDVCNAPEFLVEWLLQLFDAVDVLRLRHITNTKAAALRRDIHVVKHLETARVDIDVFPHLSEILECTTLGELAIDVNGLDKDSSEAVLNNFVRKFGHNLRAFRYINCSKGLYRLITPNPPVLHAYKTIASVTLTTNAFTPGRGSARCERVPVFLESLPACIPHVRLTWDNDADLRENVGQVDWRAIGRKLDAYASLSSVEIGCIQPVPDHALFVNHASARATVLERFPERLRSITVFV